MLADDLCQMLIRAGVSAFAMESVGSTQDEAARLGMSGGRAPLVVVARSQASGRGRMGRKWLSPGGGMYASILFRPDGEPAPGLTVRVGAAVVSTLRGHGVSGAALKWPNDCLVEGRKMCGILVESFPRDKTVIVGVGMNVVADPELAAVAGLPGGYPAASLREFCDDDPAVVCTDVVMAIMAAFESARVGEPLDVDTIGMMLWTRGPVQAAGGAHGMVVGVDGDGSLVLRQPDGRIRQVSFGEVHDAGSH